jgi:hypothetical protein
MTPSSWRISLIYEDTAKGYRTLEALVAIYCGLEAGSKEKFLGDRLKPKGQADCWQVVSDEALWRCCAADSCGARRVHDALMDRLPALRDLDRQYYLGLQRAISEAKPVGFSLHRTGLNEYEPPPQQPFPTSLVAG